VLAAGDLLELGRALASDSCTLERPVMRTLPLALLACAGAETALVVSTNGELLWVMRYRCETQT
jgi:hypothetical protein